MHAMILALVCNLIALILYPTQFLAELEEESNRFAWELDFAYGLVRLLYPCFFSVYNSFKFANSVD